MVSQSSLRREKLFQTKMADFEKQSTEEVVFKWSKEKTKQFIRLRGSRKALFTGAAHSDTSAWNAILEELGLQGSVTALQAKKKWNHLKIKYKKRRKRERDQKLMDFIREDMRQRREFEERRAQENREMMDRLFSLLEKMIQK